MICIIPARGGSKRLPYKNLNTLDGEFIINLVVKIAKASNLFDEIIVSTDSESIADIVIGATVSMRPPEISGDVPEDKVLKWTVEKYWGLNFCRIYPFAVLLTPERLCNGYKEFITGKYENVMECQQYGHPIQRSIWYFKGKYQYFVPYYISLPTEELGAYYHDAGTYMFTHKGSLDKPLAERKIKWLPVTEQEAQDVDTAEDWEMLRMKFEWRNR